MEERANYFCIRCMKSLTGKQQKFCSEKCRKKLLIRGGKKALWAT